MVSAQLLNILGLKKHQHLLQGQNHILKKKQIVAFLLHVIMVHGVVPKVPLMRFTNSNFVVMSSIIVLKASRGNM
jgi:hypothetical protein